MEKVIPMYPPIFAWVGWGVGLKTELTLFSLESEKHQMHKVHTCRLLLTSFLDSEWGECGKPMFHFSFAYTGLCKTTKKD